MVRMRRIGAALLISGAVLILLHQVLLTGVGLLPQGNQLLFLLVAVTSAAVPVATFAIPSLVIDIGLIVTGASFRGRGRAGLLVAGVLSLTATVLGIAQFFAGSVIGAEPTRVVEIVSGLAIVAAGVLLASDTRLDSAARWSIVIPAIGVVLAWAVQALPPALWGAAALLPSLGYAIAGVLLLRSASSDESAPALAAAG